MPRNPVQKSHVPYPTDNAEAVNAPRKRKRNPTKTGKYPTRYDNEHEQVY